MFLFINAHACCFTKSPEKKSLILGSTFGQKINVTGRQNKNNISEFPPGSLLSLNIHFVQDLSWNRMFSRVFTAGNTRNICILKEYHLDFFYSWWAHSKWWCQVSVELERLLHKRKSVMNFKECSCGVRWRQSMISCALQLPKSY